MNVSASWLNLWPKRPINWLKVSLLSKDLIVSSERPLSFMHFFALIYNRWSTFSFPWTVGWQRKNVKEWIIYWKLDSLASDVPNICNYNKQVIDKNGEHKTNFVYNKICWGLKLWVSLLNIFQLHQKLVPAKVRIILKSHCNPMFGFV